MKTILVPTDFSECADNALEFAISVAKINDSEIIVLSSYYIPSSGGVGAMRNLQENLRKETEIQLLNLLEKKKAKYPFLKVKSYTDFNVPSSSIIRFVNNLDVDLVVMGTTGASGVKEVLMGSTTSVIIDKVSVPIFAIHKETSFDILNKISIATDLSGLKDLKSMKRVKIISDILNFKIEFLSIYTEMTEKLKKQIELKKERMNEIFGEENYTLNLIKSDDIENAILDNVEENSILAVVSRSRGFFEKLFHSSMSKKLSMHSKNPILVLHD